MKVGETLKIKMTTCVVSEDLLTYDINVVYTVGENISKQQAKSFINANFAVEIKEQSDNTVSKIKKKVLKNEQQI